MLISYKWRKFKYIDVEIISVFNVLLNYWSSYTMTYLLMMYYKKWYLAVGPFYWLVAEKNRSLVKYELEKTVLDM